MKANQIEIGILAIIILSIKSADNRFAPPLIMHFIPLMMYFNKKIKYIVGKFLLITKHRINRKIDEYNIMRD
jgi:hypothetical protein